MTENFAPDNIGRLEPLCLQCFAYIRTRRLSLPHVNVSEQGCKVVSGPHSGRSHSVVPYSGTKCHEVIYTLYYPDNPVTLRTGVHKGTLREPWATAPCEFSFCVGHNKGNQGFWYSKSCKLRGSGFRNVASKIYCHKTCLLKCSIKNPI